MVVVHGRLVVFVGLVVGHFGMSPLVIVGPCMPVGFVVGQPWSWFVVRRQVVIVRQLVVHSGLSLAGPLVPLLVMLACSRGSVARIAVLCLRQTYAIGAGCGGGAYVGSSSSSSSIRLMTGLVVRGCG